MMRKILIISGILLLGTTVASATPPIYFVSPTGNDSWSGRLPGASSDVEDGPFATLLQARNAIRKLAGESGLKEGATVYLRAGNYYLSEALRLEAQDSGSADHPVIWRAYGDEKVRLIGGEKLPPFEVHEGAIMKCVLKDHLSEGPPPQQLFCNGERQIPARWPNSGEGSLPGGGWTFIAKAASQDNKSRFHYSGDRPSRWKQSKELTISIWPNYNWWQTIAVVKELDVANKIIQLEEDLPYTIEPGRRFFFQNIFEELDAPKEWYLDTDTQTLYFQAEKSLDKAEVILPQCENIFQIHNAHDIVFLGLSLEATRSDAVRFTDCEACLLAKCTIRNTGEFGIVVSGGHSVRLMGNDIYHTGRGGVILTGGDRKTLEPGNHHATNNHIHHFAQRYKTYQSGINVNGVGNHVTHNLIHDAPHIAILLTGNDHDIGYNHIHHVCLEGSDNGAFYMGRDWTQRGNRFHHNIVHDVYGFGLKGLKADKDGVYHYESPHQAWGVYLDDCSSGVYVTHNLFYRIPLCGVMIGGGRDNVVRNNIFVECIPALHIDDRWDSFCWDIMQERLEAVDYSHPPYSERYPKLLEMGDDPRKPENNRFVSNIISYQADDFRGLSSAQSGSNTAVVYDFDQFDPESTFIDKNLIYHHDKDIRIAWSVYQKKDRKTLSWEAWQEKGFDKDSLLMPPEFFDEKQDDYRLRNAGKMKRKINFNPIPLEEIGLYQDEFRASWPPPKAAPKVAVKHQSFPVTLEP